MNFLGTIEYSSSESDFFSWVLIKTAALYGTFCPRFCRLRNYNIIYICGTDEYGTATETKVISRFISLTACHEYIVISP